MGLFALRAGYRSGSDIEGLTLGAGFTIQRMDIDYAFGMADEFDSRQRVSVRMKFGGKEQ